MSLRGLYHVVLLTANSTGRRMRMLVLTGDELLLLLQSYDLRLLLLMLSCVVYLGLVLILTQLRFSPSSLAVMHLFAFPLSLLKLGLLGSVLSNLGLVLGLGFVLAARLLLVSDFDIFKGLEAFEARLKRCCPRFAISSGRDSICGGRSETLVHNEHESLFLGCEGFVGS